MLELVEYYWQATSGVIAVHQNYKLWWGQGAPLQKKSFSLGSLSQIFYPISILIIEQKMYLVETRSKLSLSNNCTVPCVCDRYWWQVLLVRPNNRAFTYKSSNFFKKYWESKRFSNVSWNCFSIYYLTIDEAVYQHSVNNRKSMRILYQ